MHIAYLNNATHTLTLKYETLLKVFWNQQDLVWENFNDVVQMVAFCTKVRRQTQMQKSEGQVVLAFDSSACHSICGMPNELWLVECSLTTGAGTSNLKPSPVPNLAPSLPQTISTLSLSLPCLTSPNKRKGLGEQNQEKSPGRMEQRQKVKIDEIFWHFLCLTQRHAFPTALPGSPFLPLCRAIGSTLTSMDSCQISWPFSAWCLQKQFAYVRFCAFLENCFSPVVCGNACSYFLFP